MTLGGLARSAGLGLLLVTAASAQDFGTGTPIPVAAPEPLAPPPPAPGALPAWNSTASLGLVALTGNARTTTVNAALATERRSTAWIFAGKVVGVYGIARPAGGGPASVNALAAGLQARADRRFGPRLSAYLTGELDSDHVKSIEVRTAAELGAAYALVDRQLEPDVPFLLRADLGFRLAREYRFQYYPTPANLPEATLAAPKVGLSLRRGFSKDVLLQVDAEALSSLTGPSRWVLSSTAKLVARLSPRVGIGTSFAVLHDSSPAPEKLPTDTALAATFEARF